MAGASARNDADFSFFRRVYSGNDASFVILARPDKLHDVAVAFHESFQHLVNDIVRVI